METYFDERIERMPRSEIRALQEKYFQALMDYVWEYQAPYREKMNESSIHRNDIMSLEDISKLPFTDKKDLAKNYPFTMQAAPDTDIIRINATSGSTGKMVMIPCTDYDVDLFENGLCRALAMLGCTKNSRVQNTFSYSMFIGGMGVQGAAERFGAACIPTSTGNTERQKAFLKELGVDILAATPSYALYIIDEMAQNGELDDISLKSIFVAGEPCSSVVKNKIENLSGATVYNVYGNAEMTNVFASCRHNTGMHIPEDMIYAEIVDKDGNVLPYGEAGELVITTLQKKGLPLVRYNTHDIAVICDDECPCQRTSLRVKIIGRSDGMIIHKGCKFFPSDVDNVIAGLDFLNGKYTISKTENGMGVAITAELCNGLICNEESCFKQFADACRGRLGVLPELILVRAGTLEHPQGEKKSLF